MVNQYYDDEVSRHNLEVEQARIDRNYKEIAKKTAYKSNRDISD
jgi:hypothetical protein